MRNYIIKELTDAIDDGARYLTYYDILDGEQWAWK